MLEGNRHTLHCRASAKIGQKFYGPVFIVGMPRSGTKLLRHLINQHSKVAILPHESHFIPYFYKKICKFGDLSERRNFDIFYRHVCTSGLFRKMRERNNAIDRDTWYNAVLEWSYAGVIRGLYSGYAEAKSKCVFGDKTPSYMTQIPLLSQLFPEARFIHILRDPRDYCVSIRAAWGKNVYRAAQRWNDDVRKCRADAAGLLAGHYFEVKYEDLVENPQTVLSNICEFLSIGFEKEMLILSKPVENVGDAKGALEIIRTNTGKWRQKLSSSEIVAVESILRSEMSRVGYVASTHEQEYKLSKWRMTLYKCIDGVHLLFYYIRRKRQLWQTIRWILMERIHSAYKH